MEGGGKGEVGRRGRGRGEKGRKKGEGVAEKWEGEVKPQEDIETGGRAEWGGEGAGGWVSVEKPRLTRSNRRAKK